MTRENEAPSPAKLKVRDAATLIVQRRGPNGTSVLMGQRGATAAFMPQKFVFPGGAVDEQDAHVALADPLAQATRQRLIQSSDLPPESIAAAAIRELWEETGLIFGVKSTGWPDDASPLDWQTFAATGHRPTGTGLRFIFRAITPRGNTRRFDARFLIAEADGVATDLDDFSHATDELSSLQWVPLAEARRLDLPFITKVVLAEVAAATGVHHQPDTIPFFRNDDEANLVRQLDGTEPLG